MPDVLINLAQIRRREMCRRRYRKGGIPTRFKAFTGWTAHIIQHGAGHCDCGRAAKNSGAE